MRLTLLGTGTSFGVPQIGCGCEVCRSSDPRDRRTRCSAILETPGATILIDTPPELRVQLLAARITRLDAVLYTHEHADHVAGIDDLRVFSVMRRAPLPVFASEGMIRFLTASYRYIFDPDQVPIAGTSKPSLTLLPLVPGTTALVAGIPVLPVEVEHGQQRVLGFRIGTLAYVTDAKQVSEAARSALRGVDTLVLNALWWRPHPTHLSIPEAIETAAAIGARRTILTHLTHQTGHAELAGRLPPGVEPGYDGQILEIPA